MCDYYPCILTRDGTVLDLPDTSSHDDIITANKLNDNKLSDRDFIRIEITPNEPIHMLSTKRSDWKLVVDEPHTIPGWYEEDVSSLNERCWNAWENAIQRDIHSKFDVPKALALLGEVKSIRWMQNHEEPLPEWVMFDTRGTARVAARDATRDAFGVAARVAARDAVWDAFRVATRDAVWDAFRVADWVAFRDAVWDAAWDVNFHILTQGIPNLDQVHKDHMEQRMEVWRRGYGCLGDADGKLYVYRRV